MEIGQPEAVGVNDNDGVGIGYVNTVFHNGGAEQHIGVVVDKSYHGALQVGRRHLPVCYSYAGFGKALPDDFCKSRQRSDARCYHKSLPAPVEFSADGLSEHFGVEGMNFRLNGTAPFRGCLQKREITRSHEGKLECAWNRGGGEGKGVNVGSELANAFFYGHTEFLLFINDEQTQVMKLYAAADGEFMGADEDVNTSFAQVGQYLPGLGRRSGTAEVVNPYGKIFEPPLKRMKML